MNQKIRDSIQLTVKGNASNVDELGRKQILKRLTETADPWISIEDIRSKFSMANQSIQPALSFLNILSTSVLSSHQKKILVMLQMTIHFLSIHHLKSIPIHLIQSLHRIPEKYIHYLANNIALDELPMKIRRQIWEYHDNLFINYFSPICQDYLKLVDRMRIPDRKVYESEISKICMGIGGSEKLFTSFSNYCRKSMFQNKGSNWSSLYREVLITIQSSEEYKLQSLGKLNELVWLLDSCIRQGRVEIASVYSVISTIESLIISCIKRIEDPTLRSTYQINVKPKISNVHKSETKIKSIKSEDKSITIDLPSILNQAWKFLFNQDIRKLFASRVTDAIAPRYSEIIKNPMDLGTMKQKIKKAVYTSFEQFMSDISLMFSNCIQYNGADSTNGRYGRNLEAKWGRKIDHFKSLMQNSDLYPYEISSSSSSSSERIGDDEPGIKRIRFTLSETQPNNSKEKHPLSITLPLKESFVQEFVKRHVKDLMSALIDLGITCLFHIDKDHTFSEPVTDDIAPEYSIVIAKPICISDMKNKYDKGIYQYIKELNDDVHLMLENCYDYNGVKSEIAKRANKLKKKWSEMYSILVKVLQNQDKDENEEKNKEKCEVYSISQNDVNKIMKEDSTLVLKVSTSKKSLKHEKNEHRNILSNINHFGYSQSLTYPESSPYILENEEINWNALETDIQRNYSEFDIHTFLDFLCVVLILLDSYGIFAFTPTHYDYCYDQISPSLFDIGLIRIKSDRNLYSSVNNFVQDVVKMVEIKKNMSNHHIQNIETKPMILFEERVKKLITLLDKNGIIDHLLNELPSIDSKDQPNYHDMMDTVPKLKLVLESNSTSNNQVTYNSHSESLLLEKAQQQVQQLEEKESNQSSKKRKSEIISSSISSQTMNSNLNNIKGTNYRPDVYKPVLSQQVLSKTNESNALSTLREIGNKMKQNSSKEDLPEFRMDDKISWAVLLLQDPKIQQFLIHLLCKQLYESFNNSIHRGDVNCCYLPVDDKFVRIVCQFLQLPRRSEELIYPSVDENLLRYYLPYILLRVNQSTNQQERMEINEIRSSCQEIVQSISPYVDDNSMNTLLERIAKYTFDMKYSMR